MKSHMSKITDPKIIQFACGMMINMLISKRDVFKLRLCGKDVCVVDVTCFASEVLGSLFNPLATKLVMDDEIFNPLTTKLGMDEIFNPLTTKLGMYENLHNKSLSVDCCLTNEIIHRIYSKSIMH